MGGFRGGAGALAAIHSASRALLASRGLSKTTENELLDCWLTAARGFMRQKLKGPLFVATEADGIMDISKCTMNLGWLPATSVVAKAQP